MSDKFTHREKVLLIYQSRILLSYHTGGHIITIEKNKCEKQNSQIVRTKDFFYQTEQNRRLTRNETF